MSKRSFEEFSTITSSCRHTSALDHADNLLKAAQSLKQDLEQLRSPSHEKILSTLKRHNALILPAAQALCQDETTSMSKAPESSHKIQRVHQERTPSESRPQTGLWIPNPESLTKWTPQDVPGIDVLPPLPPVLDPILEVAARTHAGIANGLKEMDYERLEFIGDAYLYLISSAFIYQTFPALSPGRCSQLRERLVKNETLSEFTVQYNLDRRARLPTEYQPGGRPSQTGAGTSASKKERKKILGDLFEAYTAAVILGDSDGLSRVIPWLKSIWGTTLKREIQDEYKKPNLGPKETLKLIVGAKGVLISYRDEGKPKLDKNSGLPWMTVGVYYDGLGESNLCLGYGSGLSKKEAGNKAAVKALENKKLIKRLQKLKEDVNAALSRS
ncbi:ribonuclease III domain-containing protein [Nemania serpens]|nr:ribonuclease III domain-containing protein [Nemania serpens]